MTGQEFLEQLEHLAIHLRSFIREFSNGIFVLLGVFLGSWLSRRSELMRIRVERKTEIFDEACHLMAEYSSSILQDDMRPGANFGAIDEVLRTTIALDWKIKTHFSIAAHRAWSEVEEMILTATSDERFTEKNFGEVAEKTLNALGAEIK